MKLRSRAALFLCGLPMLAFAEPIAEVMAVRGDATLAARPLTVGEKLERGAELRTGADGRVRLRFVDGSTLVISDRTVMKVERFDLAGDKRREAASFLLQTGLIGQKVAPSYNGSWEVRTPTAVTAVRGTEFLVEVGTDEATSVSVQSGKVDVEAVQSAAGGGTRSLRPRSRVTLSDPMASTQCNPTTGCSPSANWSADRLKNAQDRLSLD